MLACGTVCQLTSGGCAPRVNLLPYPTSASGSGTHSSSWHLVQSSTGCVPLSPPWKNDMVQLIVRKGFTGGSIRDNPAGVKSHTPWGAALPPPGRSTSTLSTLCFLLRVSSCPTQVGYHCPAPGISLGLSEEHKECCSCGPAGDARLQGRDCSNRHTGPPGCLQCPGSPCSRLELLRATLGQRLRSAKKQQGQFCHPTTPCPAAVMALSLHSGDWLQDPLPSAAPLARGLGVLPLRV